MTRKLFVVVAVLGSALLPACSPPSPPPAPLNDAKPDLAAEERAIREADARWLKAAQARDLPVEAAVFASDGVAYREHLPPIVGPAAYQAYASKFRSDNPKEKPSWSTDMIQVASSGDLAIQTGEYHLTGLGPKGDGEDRGRFVTVWKKVNGEWKVSHDIGSTAMPEVAVKKP